MLLLACTETQLCSCFQPEDSECIMDFAHIPPSFLFNCTAQGTPQEVELKFTLNVSFKANDSMNNSASTQHNTRGMEDIQLLVCGEKN